MRRPQPEVQIQLAKAGYLATGYVIDGPAVRLVLDETLRQQLDRDEHFQRGPFYGLHHDVGDHLRDYRSWRNEFGKGSLQIVVDEVTGNAYADVDRWNMQDVVNIVGHSWDVIRGFFGRSA